MIPLPSFWHRLTQRVSGWLLAALVLATLAPGISRALAWGASDLQQAGGGDRWVELCTSEGMTWVALPLDGSPHGGSDHTDPGALDRCGHCTLAAERFAPLAPSLPLLPVAIGQPAAPWPCTVPVFEAAAPSPGARDPPRLG